MSFLSGPYGIALFVFNIFVAYWLLGYLTTDTKNKPEAKKGPVMKIPPTTLKYRDYTLDELLPYNGDELEHVLIAVDQRIYDVTTGRHHYGPGGSYAALAGRDASRSLATHIIPQLKTDSLQGWDELIDLTDKERSILNDWVAFFDFKYPRVGTLVPNHSWGGSGQEDQPEVVHGAILESIDFEQQLKDASKAFDADVEADSDVEEMFEKQ
ncbi:hypothetical protein PSACC_02759 [Paramicrosporidium saccamoebae]|uniref:Cytochrome b5 heme-binding domain-containing protein n=1 Tax=Paramicrosporidium saccamoebae TaxID=1246581 RepID=A0A2H9TI62_9FUNG|nr:hypothetical protein PSACC_02759 [Paramicrosporidium saccamoebae]